MPCKYIVSDFFIVEKTFALYEKFLFSEEKTFAIFRFTIFEGRNFRENGQKSQKSRMFLLLKYPKFHRTVKLNLMNSKFHETVKINLVNSEFYEMVKLI